MDIKKLNLILMRTVAVLLILVMLSTSMVAGRYARYVSTASGSDSARVAKFLVTSTGELKTFTNITIVPGATVTKTLEVVNDSEVTVECDFAVKNYYNNLPLTFTCQGTDGAGKVIAPGGTGKIDLLISWPASANSDSNIGKVDLIEITLSAVQVD